MDVMANIKKDDKTGTYFFKISLGTDPSTGKRRQTTRRGFKKNVDSIKSYNELKNSYYSGDLHFNQKTKISDFYTDYLALAKNNLKESTYDARDNAMRGSIIKEFGNYRLDQIKAIEVQRWMHSQLERGYSPATINQHLSFFKDLMNKAVDLDLIDSNKLSKVRPLKIPKEEMNVWTVDELDKFLSTFDLKNPKELMYYTLFTLLFYTGLRINEALALTKSDISDVHIEVNKIIYMKFKNEWKLTTPKSKNSKRSVTLDSNTYKVLMRWVDQAPYDFLFSLDGEPISHQTVGYFLKKHAQLADVKKIRVHDLRHSHASLLINLNINILAVAKRLGHKDATQIIETYGHLYPEYQFDIVKNIDDFKNGVK